MIPGPMEHLRATAIAFVGGAVTVLAAQAYKAWTERTSKETNEGFFARWFS